MEPSRIHEVIIVINSLNSHKFHGHNDIPTFFLQVLSSIIASALCYFIVYD